MISDLYTWTKVAIDWYNHNKFYVSDASEYKLREGHIQELKNMIETSYGSYSAKDGYGRKELRRILKWVFGCISCSDIITLFDIRRYWENI